MGTAVLALVCAAAVQAAALDIGDSMPAADVKMKNVDGELLALSDIVGPRGTLVIFSCNHCPYVKAWQERMVAIVNESVPKGIGAAMVNANDADKYPTDGFEHMQKQAEKDGFEFPYLVDATSDVARAFGAKRTPEVFLFSAAGKLVYHGAVDDNVHEPKKVEEHYLRDAVDALLTGKPISTPKTGSIGCSIKFRRQK
jgi:peroxiredoxin